MQPPQGREGKRKLSQTLHSQLSTSTLLLGSDREWTEVIVFEQSVHEHHPPKMMSHKGMDIFTLDIFLWFHQTVTDCKSQDAERRKTDWHPWKC